MIETFCILEIIVRVCMLMDTVFHENHRQHELPFHILAVIGHKKAKFITNIKLL